MESYGILWNPMESYGYLWIPIDSYGFLSQPASRPASQPGGHLDSKIGKNGKSIPESEALSYVSGITLGLDLTLRDVQKKLKMAGLPWELSKSFEQSAPLGIFKRYNPKEIDIKNLNFSCSVNGNLRQKGNTQEMIFSISNLIHILSNWWTLKSGDIVFTGTPAGVGPLKPGDKVEVESPMIGSFFWKLSQEQLLHF